MSMATRNLRIGEMCPCVVSSTGGFGETLFCCCSTQVPADPVRQAEEAAAGEAGVRPGCGQEQKGKCLSFSEVCSWNKITMHDVLGRSFCIPKIIPGKTCQNSANIKTSVIIIPIT